MKLGICYMVFDGEELLEFAASHIRNQIDHISVTYQTTSYFGNPCDPNLPNLINKLKGDKLIDEAIHYEPNLSLHPKENELKLRNLGLELSRNANCTHHISADVDEFYSSEQMKFAKETMDDSDFSMVHYINYYKEPTFLVANPKDLLITFIHPVENQYKIIEDFPFRIETTRRLSKYNKYKIFSKNEVLQHHMSYVRKDIRKKFANSCNSSYYDMKKFYSDFDKHQVGDRACLIPDYLNRRTTKVENQFNIHF